MIIIHYFSLFVCFILFCVYRLWCIKFIFFQYIFVFVFSFRISRDAHTRILFFSIQPNHHRCVHVVGVSYQTDARVHTQYSHGKEIGSQIITRQEQRMNNIKKKKQYEYVKELENYLKLYVICVWLARVCVCLSMLAERSSVADIVRIHPRFALAHKHTRQCNLPAQTAQHNNETKAKKKIY